MRKIQMTEETSTTANAAETTATDNVTTETTTTPSSILGGASTVGKPEFVPDKFWNKDKGEANVEALSKSYKELEARLGSTRPTVPDFDKATPEETKAFWKSLGAGEKGEDYEVNIPEGITPDEKFLTGFKEFAAANSIPKAIAGKLADWYIGQQVEEITNWNKSQEDNAKVLKNEWGGDYQKNLDGAWNALTTLNGAEVASQMLGRYGNDIGFIKMMHNINSKITEDTVREPTVNISSIASNNEEMKKEYMAIKSDKKHPLNAAYWNVQHPQRQEAVNRLSELQKNIKW